MAKGVVMCPVINQSIALSPTAIINYGTPSIPANYYCVGYQRSNTTDIPVLYAGRFGDYGCYIAYGASYQSVSVYYAQTNSTATGNIPLSSIGSVSGLSYSYATPGFNGNVAAFPSAVTQYDKFNSVEDMALFISNMVNVSIQYNSGLIAVAGPKLVAEGSQVRAFLSIPRGVTVSESDITVKKSGVAVSFNYQNGTLTFTA